MSSTRITFMRLAAGLLLLGLAGCGAFEVYDPPLSSQPSLVPTRLKGDRWLFSYKDGTASVHSLYLVGNFVSDKKPLIRYPMHDVNGDGIWRCAVPLDPGQYAFKFLVNERLLVAPTHAAALERTMNGAGQVFVPDTDAPYVTQMTPADETTVSELGEIKFRLDGNTGALNLGDIRVSLNGQPLAVTVDREKSIVRAKISDPKEGQYLVQISGQDTSGNDILEYQSLFFYYRARISRIADTKFEGALAYRVLVPAFTESTNLSGSLADIIARLDYLNDGKGDEGTGLGVKLLVLYGLLPAADIWGSEITGYENLRDGLGGRGLLGRLADECHRRGIRLVIQFNLAYISNQHEFFQDAYGNPGSKKWDWFYFLNDTGTRYLGYADDPSLPRLNTASETASTYLCDIVRNWAASGIDGFLFEHADLLPEKWWLKVRESAISGAGRDDILVAGSCHGGGDYVNQLFQGKFNMTETMNHANELSVAMVGARPEALSSSLVDLAAAVPHGGAWLRPTANREMPRLASILDGPMRVRAALGHLLTGGGVPMLQWGDELDVKSPDQPLERDPSPMPWSIVSNRRAEPGSTWNLVRTLTRLRVRYPELRRELDGSRPVLRWADEPEPGYAAFVRQTTPERFFVGIMVLDRGRREASPSFTLPLPGPAAEGRYRGRDMLQPGGASLVTKVENGESHDLTFPIQSERGFYLYLFERLTTTGN